MNHATIIGGKMQNNSPCNECICVPICRNRLFNDMMNGCSILKELLYSNKAIHTSSRTSIYVKEGFWDNLDLIYYDLQPLYWRPYKYKQWVEESNTKPLNVYQRRSRRSIKMFPHRDSGDLNKELREKNENTL
jgi:hypothetical protein